jgi:hypothetical protein
MNVRITLVAAAALVLAWLSASAAASAIWVRVRPELATRSVIARGPALERSAVFILAKTAMQGNGAQAPSIALPNSIPPQSVRLARQAFAREPLAADALEVLALDANARGRKKAADALFADVHQLTKRNAMADLWLARRAAENRNMPAALTHFDELLRSSPAVREPILQQVAMATRDSRFREGMARLLASSPVWSPDFWRVASAIPTAAPSVAQLRIGLVGKGLQFDPESDKALALGLLDQHQFGIAEVLYRKISGRPASANEKVRNPRFDHQSILPPIDWMTYSVGDFGSGIVPRSGRMYLSAVASPGGGVAREWVSLDPGRYVLTSTLHVDETSGSDDRVVARLSCIRSDLTQDFVLRRGTDRHQFLVPSGGCENYWLDVVASPAEGSPGLDAELSLLSITSVSASR